LAQLKQTYAGWAAGQEKVATFSSRLLVLLFLFNFSFLALGSQLLISAFDFQLLILSS
jgi:hypothetical protein